MFWDKRRGGSARFGAAESAVAFAAVFGYNE